jgi:hypothetical protein
MAVVREWGRNDAAVILFGTMTGDRSLRNNPGSVNPYAGSPDPRFRFIFNGIKTF